MQGHHFPRAICTSRNSSHARSLPRHQNTRPFLVRLQPTPRMIGKATQTGRRTPAANATGSSSRESAVRASARGPAPRRIGRHSGTAPAESGQNRGRPQARSPAQARHHARPSAPTPLCPARLPAPRSPNSHATESALNQVPGQSPLRPQCTAVGSTDRMGFVQPRMPVQGWNE